MKFCGSGPALKVCNLAIANVPPPDLFANLKQTCTPVAIKSRRYNPSQLEFIRAETNELLKSGISNPINRHGERKY
jgi:hypothetical protein